MKVGYYPGCTLKDKARSLDDTTRLAVELLGSELVEIPDWTCCSATTPLTETKIANLIPQTRLLIKTRDAGFDTVVTTCPFCFSTLRMTNKIFSEDELKSKRINSYLAEDRRLREYDEPPPEFVPYAGTVKVIHLLEWLRDHVGFDAIGSLAKNRLAGLKVAPFYGCQLLRPAGALRIDDPEDPSIFEKFLEVLGIKVIDFPERIDCCGSYLGIARPEATIRASNAILTAARIRGADLIAVTCPLCFYNFDNLQPKILNKYPDFRAIPVMYFTQLLALALGAPISKIGIGDHVVSPVPLLETLSALCAEVKS